MDYKSLITADTKRCTVDKANPCAFTKKNFPDKQCNGNCNFLLQFNKTIVRDNLGKQVMKILAYFFKIEVLQTAIA